MRVRVKMWGLLLTIATSVTLTESEARAEPRAGSVHATPGSPESLCRTNVTARAGMTARMYCCLGVRHRGAEVRVH